MTADELARFKQYVAQLHEPESFQYVLRFLQTELEHDPKPGLVKALAEAFIKHEAK